MKQGSAKSCKEKGCNGKPKKVTKATTFIGTYCTVCMKVVEYEDSNTTQQEENVENQKLKKDKSMEVNEAEIKELEKKKKAKTEKNPVGKQTKMF